MHKITTKKSPYPKCERCWNHRKTCAYNKYLEDTLCYRCVQVLCDLANRGKWLKCPACLEWFFNKNGTPEDINDNLICLECFTEMKK